MQNPPATVHRCQRCGWVIRKQTRRPPKAPCGFPSPGRPAAQSLLFATLFYAPFCILLYFVFRPQPPEARANKRRNSRIIQIRRGAYTLRLICLECIYLCLCGGAHRANTSASTALGAQLRIDLIFAVTLRNRAYRAFSLARATRNTFVRNCICHGDTSLIRFPFYYTMPAAKSNRYIANNHFLF